MHHSDAMLTEEFARGAVVKSRAGRDRGLLLAVVKADGAYVYVCDGKARRGRSPKRKNPRHLENIGLRLDESRLRSDRALRKALAQVRDQIEEENGIVQAR